MKEQNNIDKMFRDQLYDRNVDYDPSAWIEAEKMIVDQEKKRFFLYRFRYYLSALLIGLISSFVFFSGSDGQSNKISIASASGIEERKEQITSDARQTIEVPKEKSNQNALNPDK